MRPDLRLSELANGSAKDLLCLGRPEIHGDETVSYREKGAGSGTGQRRVDNTVMKKRLATVLLTLCCWALATPCDADLTAFVGANATPSSRAVRGFALGLSLLIIGFEFEFSDSIEDEMAGAPSLRTGMFNVLLQTPIPIAGLQFYGTIGGGVYRERLEAEATQETHGGVNAGGGVKITLVGPLRVRVDYRVFALGGNPLHARPQRIYAGLNLAF